MQRLLHWYSYVNILSLDIAAGAVASALFFAHILQVQILPYGLAALALTVWIIYTADHLRDAIVIKRAASSERHRFHQKHFKLLSILLVIAIILDLAITLYARKPVFRWGINLASIVLVYLVIQRYLKFLKEVFIAVLYTCGVLLPSMSVTDVTLTTNHYILFFQFAMVALINLYIFSWCDFESDIADHQQSFATTVGRNKTRVVIYVLASLVVMVATYLVIQQFFPLATFIIFLMASLHLLVLLWPEKSMARKNYRSFADALFILPIIYLLWMKL